MSQDDDARLPQAISEALSPLPEVRAALLFGSRATGRARPDSDVDVAVLLDLGLAPADAKGRLRRLYGALGTRLATDRVDLVILNDAPPALAFQVLKHGVVVFERDRRDLVRLRVRTYAAHADRAHVERLFREATRERLLAAAGEGEHG